jgi:hypothetical protein
LYKLERSNELIDMVKSPPTLQFLSSVATLNVLLKDRYYISKQTEYMNYVLKTFLERGEEHLCTNLFRNREECFIRTTYASPWRMHGFLKTRFNWSCTSVEIVKEGSQKCKRKNVWCEESCQRKNFCKRL